MEGDGRIRYGDVAGLHLILQIRALRVLARPRAIFEYSNFIGLSWLEGVKGRLNLKLCMPL
jgi:hypothetical protein